MKKIGFYAGLILGALGVKWLGVDREYFDDYELAYSNHVRDSHGNWISRTVHNSDPYSGDFKESRSILYYE